MNMTPKQYKHYLKTGQLPEAESKLNKYGAEKTEYNGVRYDSKREARHAADLDLLIKAGEVKKWDRQFKIELTSHGVHVCNYFIDFRVWMPDGSIEYHEVKGKETALWRLKWKIAKAQCPDWNFKLIK